MFDLDFKVKSQGHNIEVYFFEFPDIDLGNIDISITFLSHPHQEILNNV